MATARHREIVPRAIQILDRRPSARRELRLNQRVGLDFKVSRIETAGTTLVRFVPTAELKLVKQEVVLKSEAKAAPPPWFCRAAIQPGHQAAFQNLPASAFAP